MSDGLRHLADTILDQESGLAEGRYLKAGGYLNPAPAVTFGAHVPADAVLGLFEPEPGDPLWWLSFCDPAKAPPPELQRPGGPSFLGAVITQAPTLAAAITRSHVLKVNPGGEVKILGPLPERYIGQEWRDRLLTAAEVVAIPEPEGLAGD